MISFEPSTREFTIEYDKLNLAKVGTYEIPLTVTAGQVTEIEQVVTFVLNVLNPCLDTTYVWIEGTTPSEQRYVILQASEFAPYTFTHDALSIKTSPVVHTMCGDLITTATFDGSPLSLTSVPMGYDDVSGTFSIFSEDEGLVGQKTITIDSQLIEYPSNQN